VRGLGGSLVYFIDPKTDLGRVWDIEFKPVSDGESQEAGLTRVDHLSQSMMYDEMLSWMLFYTSLLEVDKVPEQEVLDPGGLVKSQVVHSKDGLLRLVLNASQSARTQSSRFLSEAFGSGVQHIALATADIVATAQRMRASGVPLLPVPENYYDDLEAKTDLDGATIDILRANAIFYDRDGDSEYFQIYTRTVEDRFFFEIVERRGYEGYGAVNAPVRLAAQARLAAGGTP
jgi:4-hydroxyphenylpyruvate dioxygenase